MGRGRGAVGPHAMPANAMWHRPTPHLACHVQESSPHLILRRFDPKVDVDLPRIARPTVIHLKDQNRPPNYLTSWENDLAAMQPSSRSHLALLDGKAVGWTVSRHPLALPDIKCGRTA
jgi:hypothetical protein